MHIYVRKSRALKPGSVKWCLFWQWYDEGKAKQKRVPRGQYGSLGFPLSLTEAEARSRADQINAQETLNPNPRNRRSNYGRQKIKFRFSIPSIIRDGEEGTTTPFFGSHPL